MKLDWFVGKRVSLTGVRLDASVTGEDEDGFRQETGSSMTFIADGVSYKVQENPSDSYRSSMESLEVVEESVPNTFPPCSVIGRRMSDDEHQKNDVIELVDEVTGKVVLAFGTRNTDDYYPCFVASFDPEAMAQNTDIAAMEAAREQARLKADAKSKAIAEEEEARAAVGWGSF